MSRWQSLVGGKDFATRVAILAAFAGLAVLVSGCSAGGAAGNDDTVVPAAVSSLASSAQPPAVWTIAQAQLMYLQDVAPGNDEDAELDLLLCSCAVAQPVSRITGDCIQRASDDQTFIYALSSGEWPANAQQPIQNLIAAVGSERDGLLVCASQTTTLDALVALFSVPFSGPAAEPVRAALGLPSRLGAGAAAAPSSQPATI